MDNPVNVGNILYANEAHFCLFALDQFGSVSFNPRLFSELQKILISAWKHRGSHLLRVQTAFGRRPILKQVWNAL